MCKSMLSILDAKKTSPIIECKKCRGQEVKFHMLTRFKNGALTGYQSISGIKGSHTYPT